MEVGDLFKMSGELHEGYWAGQVGLIVEQYPPPDEVLFILLCRGELIVIREEDGNVISERGE